jgi:outer membrane protein assembly factor BamD (BamD/ComL family)/tetratricopeptide (TPR) repeat protein
LQKATHNNHFISLITACWLAVLLLPSCNTFIGKAYENTTGRYNSYYLANEKMKEVDLALKASAKDDYHNILRIHYSIPDSTFGKSQTAGLEHVFKYASWSVRFHKRSKWADNNYILIGKVRHYQYNYKDGLETFKYVNSTSTNPRERHEALVCLMKMFTDFNEMDNVKYVIDFMDAETGMTKKNKRNYLVAKASYFQILEDYNKVHQLLDTVIPLCRRKHDKAKLAFINGQACEQLKQDAEERKKELDFDSDEVAFKNYRTTIKANPKYELWFNAKMNLMRVRKHSDLDDLEKARKYYKKMLADQKNTDYKDRIYFDFAKFERKQKEYGKAEEYYKKSAEKATANVRQKAYTYLALGEMYYEELQRFESASLYYDSTIAILPRTHKNYGNIYRRQRILKEFVEHLRIVQMEDSLQRLAKMDTSQLSQFLDDYIVKEEKRQNDLAKKLAKDAKKNAQGGANPFNTEFNPNNPNGANAAAPTTSPAGFNTGTQGAQFYFYNTTLALQGKMEFQQRWGRRKLEDFWRISNKESDLYDKPENTDAINDTSKTKKDSTSIAGNKTNANNSKSDDDNLALIKINKADLYSKIPSTPDKLKLSNDKLEASIFKLGKIYNQNLNEPANSIKSLERLIKDFPESDNVPEAHYMIYLIAKGRDSTLREMHKNILLEKYPESKFAKLLQNPNYLAENKIRNHEIMKRYKVAYSFYTVKNYKEADSLFVLIQNDYPNSEYEPKIELIRSIMKARSGKREDYRSELSAYVEKYPKGPTHDYAQSLISKYDGGKPKSARVIVDDSVSTDSTQQIPFNNPSQIPADINQDRFQEKPAELPSEIPEEARKMMEEHMRNRRSGNPEVNPETNPANQKPDTPKTPAVPPVDQKQMLEERKGF